MELPVPDEFIIGKFPYPGQQQRAEFHVSQSVQNSLNFIPKNWGYFWPWEDREYWGNVEFEHFLTDFIGERLQICLKNTRVIKTCVF